MQRERHHTTVLSTQMCTPKWRIGKAEQNHRADGSVRSRIVALNVVVRCALCDLHKESSDKGSNCFTTPKSTSAKSTSSAAESSTSWTTKRKISSKREIKTAFQQSGRVVFRKAVIWNYKRRFQVKTSPRTVTAVLNIVLRLIISLSE